MNMIPQAQLNKKGYIVIKMVEEKELPCSWCKQMDCICDNLYQEEAENDLTD